MKRLVFVFCLAFSLMSLGCASQYNYIEDDNDDKVITYTYEEMQAKYGKEFDNLVYEEDLLKKFKSLEDFEAYCGKKYKDWDCCSNTHIILSGLEIDSHIYIIYAIKGKLGYAASFTIQNRRMIDETEFATSSAFSYKIFYLE